MKLKLLTEDIKEFGTYNIRDRTYECPCGKGLVIWFKERPNGSGFGYQASFSDILWDCKACESKYEFYTDGSAELK